MLDEARLAFAEARDVGGHEIFGAHAFPRFWVLVVVKESWHLPPPEGHLSRSQNQNQSPRNWTPIPDLTNQP